jgi:hypothetical protein
MATRRFLRFVGRLWETGEFEPGLGWETPRIARRPRPDPDHRLVLLDQAGAVLVEGAVELRAPTCRTAGADGPAVMPLVGCLPLHPDGRVVLLLRGDRVLHRSTLSAERPTISAPQLHVTADGRVRATWSAEHDRPLRYNVVFIDGRRRAIPVARELLEQAFVLDATDLPGGRGCSLAVLATDGLRSDTARSLPFDLPDRPPRIVILTPSPATSLPPDQPLSLLGHAHDPAGRPLADEHLTWSIDGEIVARGRRLAPAGPLSPGTHRVELAYAREGEPGGRAEVRVEVERRSPAQGEWLRVATSMTAEGHPRASRDGQAHATPAVAC